jgi:hypothetical protein
VQHRLEILPSISEYYALRTRDALVGILFTIVQGQTPPGVSRACNHDNSAPSELFDDPLDLLRVSRRVHGVDVEDVPEIELRHEAWQRRRTPCP